MASQNNTGFKSFTPSTAVGSFSTLSSCGTTSGSAVVTYTGTAPLVGSTVYGPGIPANSVVVSFIQGTSFTLNYPATATATISVTAVLTYVPAWTVVDIQSDGTINTVSSGIGAGVLQVDLGPLFALGTATAQGALANAASVKLWTAPGTFNILTSVAVTAGGVYSVVLSGSNQGQVGAYAAGTAPYILKAITNAAAGTVGEFEFVSSAFGESQTQYAAPLTGTTVTLNNASSLVATINPAGTLAALTVVLPTSPLDGQNVTIIFTQAITTLTLTGTISTATKLTAATAGQKVTYYYNQAQGSWY